MTTVPGLSTGSPQGPDGSAHEVVHFVTFHDDKHRSSSNQRSEEPQHWSAAVESDGLMLLLLIICPPKLLCKKFVCQTKLGRLGLAPAALQELLPEVCPIANWVHRIAATDPGG
jgi:hypothetical protein